MARMRKVTLLLLCSLVSVLAGLAVKSAAAGGWAAVTLEELPVEVMVDRPFSVYFTLRQHGQRLMSGLSPTVTAVQAVTGERATVQAIETGKTGQYMATLTLPAPGQWGWSIHAFTTTYTMPPLAVMAGTRQTTSEPATELTLPVVVAMVALLAVGLMTLGSMRQRRQSWLAGMSVALLVAMAAFGRQWQQPQVLVAEGTRANVTSAQKGEALFVAKGCIQCHQNDNVTMAANLLSIGPSLTAYQSSTDFLRTWLADPPSIRPETLMPNLGLNAMEIENSIAFLRAGVVK